MTKKTVRAGRDLYNTTHRSDTTKQDTGTKVAAGRQRHRDEHKTKNTNPTQKPAQK